MLCDECKQNPARVHFTKMIDGTLSQVHLCEKCVQRMGYAGMFAALTTGNIMGPMMQMQQEQPGDIIVCDSCKRALGEIQQSGLLGCAKCYTTFAPQIETAIKQVQGRSEHLGKAPEGFRLQRDQKMEIEQNRKALSEAIAAENYELAADLRDRIRAMELELSSQQTAVKEE